MLCLLTYADMKAVNNEVVTPWKEDLLWQLYVETYNLLTLGSGRRPVHAAAGTWKATSTDIAKLLPSGTPPAEHARFSRRFSAAISEEHAEETDRRPLSAFAKARGPADGHAHGE